MKTLLLSLLWFLPLLSWTQNQRIIDALLLADMAADSCEQSLPATEKAYPLLENCLYYDGRDLILAALRQTERSFSLAGNAYKQSQQAYRLAKKMRCHEAQTKTAISLQQFRIIRQELDEARQQLIQVEQQWLMVEEKHRQAPALVDVEYEWTNSYKNYNLSNARLAILHSYEYLRLARLALAEAQLALCP